MNLLTFTNTPEPEFKVTVLEKKTVTILRDAEAIYITRSGWGDYHVIHEYGETGESMYARCTESEVERKYKVNPETILNQYDTRTAN